MASKLPVQKNDDDKDEFLHCSICAKPYDDDEHQAKFLPCLHTYCKLCLQSIAGDGDRFDCPKCYKLITLPGGYVANLPSNFVVENLKEHQKIFKLAVKCGNCDDDNLAVNFCHDCGAFQCQACIDSHQKMRSMRHHQLVTIESLQGQKCNPEIQQQNCTKHPKQDLTMYCREADCEVAVCATCCLHDHQGHDFIDIPAGTEQAVADMQRSSAHVNDRQQKLAHKRSEVDKLQQILMTNFKMKEKQMQEMTEKFHEQIDANYDKAQTCLKTLFETEMKNLTANIESVDFLAAQMTSACEFANQSRDTTQHAQLLTIRHQIMARLNELAAKELPETATNQTDFQFTEVHHSAVAQLQDLLHNLCDIKQIQQPLQQSRYKDTQTLSKSVRGNNHSAAVPIETPQVDPGRCTVHILTQISKIMKALVQTVDYSGLSMTTGGVNVEATQNGYPLVVHDNNDGTYTFSYHCQNWQKVVVMVNGERLACTPFVEW